MLGRVGVRPQRSWLDALSPGGNSKADHLKTHEALAEVEADDLANCELRLLGVNINGPIAIVDKIHVGMSDGIASRSSCIVQVAVG